MAQNPQDPSELPILTGEIVPIVGQGTRYGKASFTFSDLLPLSGQSLARTYQTNAAAALATIDPLVTAIQVERYASGTPYCPAAYRVALNSTEYSGYPSRLKFTDAGGRLWVIAEKVVDIRMAGAMGDGTTSDQDAVYACSEFFNLGDVGFDVHVGPGVYIVYGGFATPQRSGTWSGDGPEKSVLKCTLDPSADPALLCHATLWQRPAGQPQLEHITFRGIKFEGDWGGPNHTDVTKMNNGAGGRGQVFSLRNYTTVRVIDCVSDWSRRQAFVTRVCLYTYWHDVQALHCGQSGINTQGALVTILSNCALMWNGDDGLNAAFDDAVADGLNASGLIMVIGCRIHQVLKMRYGAANHVIFANNHMTFTRTGAIASTSNGESIPNHSTLITGNHIHNVVDLSVIEPSAANNAQALIISQSKEPTIGTGGDAVAAIPGIPDGSGNIITPFEYLLRMGVTFPAPGQMGVMVSNNQIGRTVAPVAAFSEYGLGDWWTKDGWIDPAFTLTELQGPTHVGAAIGTIGRNVTVSNNQFDGTHIPLQFTPLRGGANMNVRVFDNIFSNYTRWGIEQDGAGTIDMEISRNTFDGDPDRQHVRHTATGTWDSASVPSGCVGIVADASGLKVRGNTFRNLNVVHQTPADTVFEDNILECEPNFVGSFTNKGIREIFRSGPEFRYIIKGSNPSVPATWNTVLNHCPRSAAAMPSTGFWVEGAIVLNSNPTVSNGRAVEYWRRITSGSGHVLGTDWAEITAGRTHTLPFVIPVAGEYIATSTGIGGEALSPRAGVTANIDMFQFAPLWTITADQMALNVTTAAVGGLAKIVIYAADTDGRPSTPVETSTEMDFSSTGVKTATIAYTFEAGLKYWIGLRTNSVAEFSAWPLNATPDINGGATVVTTARKILRRSLSYAPAAPTPWTYVSSEINAAAAPAIWLRRA